MHRGKIESVARALLDAGTLDGEIVDRLAWGVKTCCPYRLRKQLPEPVFGQIKQARGFRQFLLRGFEKVRAEWAIVCTAHNLLKLAHRRSLPAMSLTPAA